MSEPRALTADERQQIAIGQFGMGGIHALLDRSAFLESERETLTARLREAERLLAKITNEYELSVTGEISDFQACMDVRAFLSEGQR